MAAINDAYAVLGDSQRRAAYDAELRRSRDRDADQERSSSAKSPRENLAPVQEAVVAVKRAALVMGGLAAVLWFGVERKSAWSFAWDWVSSGFSDASHYRIHWLMIIVVLAIVARLWPRHP
jgi:curved DNA-binding protein CbpA